MAKSNGRTQRPQRTSRNSSKADVETKAQPNDDVEAVEDLQAEQTEDLKHEPLDGDLLDLDDSSDRSDVVAEGAGTDGNTDTDAEAADDDKAAGDTVAKKSTAGTGKKSASKSAGAKQSADAKKTEKSEKLNQAAESDKGSKPTKKSEAATGASAKGSAAQGSSAKRTSRSGNPAKRPQGRKTATYTSQSGQQTLKPNPRWFLPVLIGLLLIGLIWLVTFYVSQGAFPVEAWGNWNILVGFAFFVAGLIMSTRWR
ncbi:MULTISPECIES: cell division protein CrgA [Brevibacterium]|uniref:Cell division protein CrgA n=1 Tax=Brevibacterium antiquum CNRZ 918 TaxID=1255637 RepID=A0A2H1I887_9MICO|nr:MULTISPECIES: cell division protein CrgA [Brevibacterium]SMX71363.1 Uncharacterised protein family (UPF0233) [Brevibacterium antiquum CNRZ 918]HCG54608.1 hypothetical protein [Brevibacterium sp.]